MVHNVYFPIFLHTGWDGVRELWVLVVGHEWLLLLNMWNGGHQPFLAGSHFSSLRFYPVEELMYPQIAYFKMVMGWVPK